MIARLHNKANRYSHAAEQRYIETDIILAHNTAQNNVVVIKTDRNTPEQTKHIRNREKKILTSEKILFL